MTPNTKNLGQLSQISLSLFNQKFMMSSVSQIERLMTTAVVCDKTTVYFSRCNFQKNI